MNLIRVGNLIINASMLIDAEFMPARTWVDEDTGNESDLEANIMLRFAGPYSEPHTNYNGDYTGHDDHAPYSRKLYGEDADYFWIQLLSLQRRRFE